MKTKGSQFLNADEMDKPVQLPMFMQARDLMDSLTRTVDYEGDSVEQVMTFKNSDHVGTGPLRESIRSKGVQVPVQIIHDDNDITMGQGHHRAAIADAVAPDSFVPVIHTDGRTGSDLGHPGWAESRRRHNQLLDSMQFVEHSENAWTSENAWRLGGSHED